jgi:predicted ATPase
VSRVPSGGRVAYGLSLIELIACKDGSLGDAFPAVQDAAQVEASFQQTLAVARRQQARAWELRTALSLSRLWQQQGKRQEAHDRLAEVYSWFTKGLDTTDLQEAVVF